MKILSNNTNVWKIFIYNKMMWELPFTLEDVIFLPLRVLEDSRIADSNYDLIKTFLLKDWKIF